MKTSISVDKTQILRKIKEYKKFSSDASFARFLEITPQGLATWYARNTFDINKIANKIPEINPVYLLTGEGEMLKNEVPKNTSALDNYVLLLPLSAQGGSLGEFSQSVRAEDCERIKSPVDGADFAISVSGDSMAPEYPNGSRVLVKKIDDRAFIEWGRTYVLDTCNGSVIKVLTPSKREDCVTCNSLNEDPRYAPFDVNLRDVFGIYRVLLCMALK